MSQYWAGDTFSGHAFMAQMEFHESRRNVPREATFALRRINRPFEVCPRQVPEEPRDIINSIDSSQGISALHLPGTNDCEFTKDEKMVGAVGLCRYAQQNLENILTSGFVKGFVRDYGKWTTRAGRSFGDGFHDVLTVRALKYDSSLTISSTLRDQKIQDEYRISTNLPGDGELYLDNQSFLLRDGSLVIIGGAGNSEMLRDYLLRLVDAFSTR